MKYWVMIALFCFIGCDKVVSKTSKHSGEVVREKSCSTGAGYCMDCGLAMDGKYDCSMKWRWDCPGSQNALFAKYDMTYIHESGKVTNGSEFVFIKDLDACN